MNIPKVIKEEINGLDWVGKVPATITTESDIEHFIGRGLNEIDPSTGEPDVIDSGKVVDLKYWIEHNGEEPEAYNICWDEIEQIPPFNSENVFKVCTRYRASSIVKMFKNGILRLIPEEQIVNEDFDWVSDVPDVELGKYFDEDDIGDKIKFEDGKIIFDLDYNEFEDMVLGVEDYYFRDVVLTNGTYEGEGDDGWFDDEEIDYYANYLSQEQENKLKEVLKRAANVFNLEGRDGFINKFVDGEFWETEKYLGSKLYKGQYDWDDITSNYMNYVNTYVERNRWRSLSQHYLKLLKDYGVEIDGDWRYQNVIVTVPFPFKYEVSKVVGDHNGNYRSIKTEKMETNLSDIFHNGFEFLNNNWHDWWYEDFDTTGVAERVRPEFDIFIENIEEALDEKENQTNTERG